MGSLGQIAHDFGTMIGIVLGFLINALISRGRRDSEIEAMKEWTKSHQKEADQRDKAISELSAIAAAMQATAKGQDRRLELLEERKQRS